VPVKPPPDSIGNDEEPINMVDVQAIVLLQPTQNLGAIVAKIATESSAMDVMIETHILRVTNDYVMNQCS
jgi:hypothetical protein